MQSEKTFDEAVKSVESETANEGFRVLHIHNVQETLQSKGFQSSELKIVEVCNANFANKMLQQELKMALFMPCRIIVYVQDEKTFISTMNVELIPQMVPEIDFSKLAAEVNSHLQSIVNKAK